MAVEQLKFKCWLHYENYSTSDKLTPVNCSLSCHQYKCRMKAKLALNIKQLLLLLTWLLGLWEFGLLKTGGSPPSMTPGKNLISLNMITQFIN